MPWKQRAVLSSAAWTDVEENWGCDAVDWRRRRLQMFRTPNSRGGRKWGVVRWRGGRERGALQLLSSEEQAARKCLWAPQADCPWWRPVEPDRAAAGGARCSTLEGRIGSLGALGQPWQESQVASASASQERKDPRMSCFVFLFFSCGTGDGTQGVLSYIPALFISMISLKF